MVLRLENLHFSYGKKKVLNGVNWEVHPGEFHSLIGVNGAGKTTLLRLIAGSLALAKKDRGTITKQKCAALLGQPRFSPKIRVQEYLLAFAAINEVDESLVLQKMHDFHIESHEFLEKLSQGNQQKVHLLRTLLQPADLVLLDEPLNYLDPLQQREFRSWVMELRQSGVAFIVSSHQLLGLKEFNPSSQYLRNGVLQEESIDFSNTLWRFEWRGQGQKAPVWEQIFRGAVQDMNHLLLEEMAKGYLLQSLEVVHEVEEKLRESGQ